MVDEPDQPAPSLGGVTYAELDALARRQAAKLDELGLEVGDRVAVVSHNSARLLTSFFGVAGSGTGAGAGQLPAPPRRGVLHRRALRCPRAVRRPRARRGALRRHRRAPLRARRRRRPVRRRGRRAPRLGARRVRDRLHQLHLRHHGAPQGRADHAPQHLGQRRHLRHARGGHRPRRLPPHPADVPRQRLGDALRDDRAGRAAGRAAQGRRGRDPAPGPRPRRDRHVRGPRGRRGRAGGGADLGGGDPRARHGADHHGRRPAADEDGRAGRGGARLGVRPDLRPHRDLAAADLQPHPRGVGRPVGRGARGPADARRSARPRRTAADRRERRGAGALQRRPGGLLGAAGGVGPRAGRRLVPHRRRRRRSATTATSRSATARRT